MKGKRVPDLLEVEWEDSQLVAGGWTTFDDLLSCREKVRCYSVGYVLADDKKGLVLASSVNNGNGAGVTIIPASQVVARRRLYARG